MRNTGFLSEYRNTLREWVNYETPTGDEERLHAFLRLLSEAFSSSGAEVSVYENENAPVMHARIGKGEKRCVLLGHADTVFPFGEAEKFDEENGRFYGAGILDMKSGLFMMKKILDAFSDCLPDDWQVEAIVNTDEESGSAKSAEMLQSLLKGAKFALVFEGSPEGNVTVQRKGIIRFQIRVKGVAAHASAGDPERKSAIYALTRILSDIYDANLPESATLNIGTVKAGRGVNIVADRAEVEGEIRALTEEEMKTAFESIEKAVSSYPAVCEIISVRPPMTGDTKLYEIAKAAAEKAGLSVSARTAGGGSDGAYASSVGVPVLDGMGAEGGRAHTRREYAEKKSLEKRYLLALECVKSAIDYFG